MKAISALRQSLVGVALVLKTKKFVLGIAERKGKIKAKLVSNARGETLIPMVKATLKKAPTSMLMSGAHTIGYYHDTVKHGKNAVC